MHLPVLLQLRIMNLLHQHLFLIKMISRKIPELKNNIKQLRIRHPNTLDAKQLLHVSSYLK